VSSDPVEELSLEVFAARVLGVSAAPDRIAGVIAQIIGDGIEIKDERVGPSGIGIASAVGEPGEIEALRSSHGDWDVEVMVPVQLRVNVQVAGATARYRIAVRVHTRIRLVPVPPCAVFVEIADIGREHIEAVVDPEGMPSRIVGWVGNINSVVGDKVVAYINDLFDSPEVLAVRRIDVARMIDRAWDAGFVVEPSAVPTREGRTPLT
jgi:hypothetical protein